MSDPSKGKERRFPTMGRALAIAATTFFIGTLALIALGMVWVGSDYYLASSSQRAQHDLAWALKPSGPLGVGLGFLGTGLMLAMLLYSLRKLFPRAHYLGPVSGWLRFHIICGIFGPILIILHGGFAAPTGLVAIAYWCMILVALSGAFGRYLFGHFPKTEAGLQMDLEHAREELTSLRAQLVAETEGADATAIGEAVTIAREFDRKASSLVGLFALDKEARQRARAIKVALLRADLPKDVHKRAKATLLGQLKLKKSLEAWTVSRQLFRYWHLFHLPLAQAMYIIIGIHIVVAVLFGGAWFELQNLPALFR